MRVNSSLLSFSIVLLSCTTIIGLSWVALQARAVPTTTTRTESRVTTVAEAAITSEPTRRLETTTTTTTVPAATSVAPETTTTSRAEEPEPMTRVASDTLGDGSSPITTTSTSSAASDDDDEADSSGPDPTGGLLAKSISHIHSDAGSENSAALVSKDGDDSEVGERHPSSAKLSEDESGPAVTDEGDQRSAKQSSYKSKSESDTLYILNMTQIDRDFLEGRAESEEQTAESWHKMNKKLKKGISGIIGSLVPFALNMSQEAKISSNCSGAMLKWVLSMNQLKAWALRMLDASGKPIAGLLEGSMTMFGNYRQCLKVRAPDDDEIEFAGAFREYFRGKYCIIQAKPWLPKKDRFYNLNSKLNSLISDEENESYDRTIFDELSEWLLAFNFVNIRYDICVPSTCSREDIQKAVNYMVKGIDMKARVLRCETDKPDGSFGVAAQVESGAPEVAEALASALADSNDTADDKALISSLKLEQISQFGWILIPLLAVIVVLIATGLSFTISETTSSQRTGKLKHTIKSLSLRRSVSSHLNVDYGLLADDKPLALYGVRFILVVWVILVESAVNLKFEYLRELMMLKDLIFWWPMQFIINSTMQYDSFILLTAFTMGYKNCLNDRIDNARAIMRYVIDKYIRLMPSIMFMVATVILMPLVYRGPVWVDYVAKQAAVCRSNGWVNSIFLQNYLPYNQICLPQTWLLCVEFQLLLIMAPIVYYLNKSYTSKFGVNNRSITLGGGNGVAKRQTFVKSTCRRDDSSKAFHWLWTAPGAFLAACMVLGLASSFYSVYHYELPPSWFYTMADPDSKALYFGEHMTKIWTHLAVFAMGILAGVECRRATKNIYRSYKGSNINFMAHTNSLTKHHKSQSSSVTSLPIILTGDAGMSNGAADTASSRMANSDWNHSSVSINILNNSGSSGSSGVGQDDGMHSPSLAGGSEIGCLNNEDKSKARGRGFCSVLIDIIGFILVITIMSAIIFSTHEWSLHDLPRPLVAGMFDAGSRFLWSLAMIWILYMISVPNKDRSFSFVAQALGHPAMVFLGKLSFLIYIIHPFVHTTVLAIQEQPIYSSWLMMFHILIGNMTITVILASMVSLFVEMPCRNLFRRCGTSLLLTQPITSSSGSTTSTNAS